MPLEIAPYVVEAAGEVMKFAIREYITKKANTVESPFVRVVEPEPTTTTGGCPYCAIGRHLAATYLYLNRLAVRPQLAGIYTELAHDQIDDAIAVLQTMPESLPNAELATTVRGYAEAVVAATDVEAATALAKRVWGTANIAMRLAEQQQDKTVKGTADGR